MCEVEGFILHKIKYSIGRGNKSNRLAQLDNLALRKKHPLLSTLMISMSYFIEFSHTTRRLGRPTHNDLQLEKGGSGWNNQDGPAESSDIRI